MAAAVAIAKPVVAGALVPAEIVFVVAAAAFLPLVATSESERLVFFSFFTFTPSCVVPHRCRSLIFNNWTHVVAS